MAVGIHIRRRRERLGMTTEQLAVCAHMILERLRAIEDGVSPSTSELAGLARHLEIEPAALYRGEVEAPPQRSAARFLAPAGISRLPHHDVALLTRAAEAGRICLQLQRLLGLPESRIRSVRNVRGTSDRREPWELGYELGQRAREFFDGSGKALQSIQQLLEDNFVHVATVAFETPDILAASLIDTEASPVVLLNARADRVTRSLSRRTVLAHELCHLLHDGGKRDLLTIVSRADGRDPVESRANGFAPNFLAPGKWVRPVLGKPVEQVLSIAKEWGLSFEAAVWHAKNLQLITPTEAENLFSQGHDVRLETEFEPVRHRASPEAQGLSVPVSPLSAGLLSELTLSAHAKHLISSGRAIEILSFE